MVYRKISDDMKERVVFLLQEKDVDEVAKLFGCSTRSIARWVANLSIYGTVSPPQSVVRG